MLSRRTAPVVVRCTAQSFVWPVARGNFATSAYETSSTPTSNVRSQMEKPSALADIKTLSEIKTKDDLFGPGAKPGTIPTDFEQATGLERLELLAKMENVDIFNMKPLDSSRKGTMGDPILVRSAGEEQYIGCTGSPADSHWVIWLGASRERPFTRCTECGSVYKMIYVGPPDDHHAHDDHRGWKEPKTFADYVKPEYW